jgi:hypothetical protein
MSIIRIRRTFLDLLLLLWLLWLLLRLRLWLWLLLRLRWLLHLRLLPSHRLLLTPPQHLRYLLFPLSPRCHRRRGSRRYRR